MGPYFAAIFDTIFCAHFWHIMPSIWAPFHGPSVRTLRPFSTHFFAPIFGTSCQPFGHHFMDPVGTIPLPFPSLPLPPRTPPSSPPLDLSSPVVCSLAYHWAGSLSEWQHASSSELPFLGPRKETMDSTIQARSTDRALQRQLVCESEEKQTQCQIIG